MFKNSAASAFASKKIASSKWLLLLCAASAAAVDIVIIAMLFAGGEGGEYLACPFILLIFDVFYFIVSLFFTNFRFKYSLGVWISYIILYTVGFSIGNAIILGGSGTVLTNGAIALWESVHGFNILCAIICALFASHIIKKLWIALAFAVLFLAGVATYAGYMFTDGFFGQGTGSRTLVYSYDNSTEAYSVTDVLAGRSKTVTVPETFNGKPVTKVSLKVFADSGIKTYNLPENIEFGDDKDALNRSLDLSRKRINVDKKSVNDIREKFLDNAVQGYVNVRQNALALANATLPVNLAENEGYVAFNYDMTDFDAAHQNTIPVYVGDLKSFDFAAYTAGYDYVKYRDDGSAKNLYWAYVNGGYILNDIADGGFEKSKVVEMNFEKVYRIRVDGGNDAKYDMREKQPELCFDNVGGTNEYKYLTKPMAKTFLNGLTPRNGFTYRWQSGNENITDLSEVIEDGMTLSVQWTLKKPTVTVRTSAPDNTITYGENVTFISEIQLEADVSLSYLWYDYDKGVRPETARELTLVAPKVAASGNYALGVTAGGDENTSLTASAVCNFDLKIEQKVLDFFWYTAADGYTYNAGEQGIPLELGSAQLVGSDEVTYAAQCSKGRYDGASSIFYMKEAGDYSVSVTIGGADAVNYTVNSNVADTFTVKRYEVPVNWSYFTSSGNNEEGSYKYEYNGREQYAYADAHGLENEPLIGGENGKFYGEILGKAKDVGKYVATATTVNTNYLLTNYTHQFEITKKDVTVSASPVSGNTFTITYGDGLPTTYNRGYNGFVQGDTPENSFTGQRKLVFTQEVINNNYAYKEGGYEQGAVLSGWTSRNYNIIYEAAPLMIEKRTVNVAWNIPADLVYDGQPKNITATVGNKVEGDDVTLTVSGGNGITADGYTATVTAIAGADAANYKLPAAVTTQYTITKRAATVVWNVPENAVYDGMEHEVTYTIQGLVAGDEQYFKFDSLKFIDAGDYVCRVQYENEEFVKQNYNLVNDGAKFTIARAQAEITVSVEKTPITESEINVETGDEFRWKSNILGVEVEAYLGGLGNRVETDSVSFLQQGTYHLMFVIPETSNYYGKSVTVTVTCSNVGSIPTPEVEQ